MENGTRQRPLDELKHHVVRLDWAERDAYGRLLRAIHESPSTREAYARWQRAREQHLGALTRLEVFEETRRASQQK